MLNRVVTRTRLNDTRDASAIRNMLEAASIGDEQNSIKVFSLLDLYSLDNARRGDLDERAVDFGAVTNGNLPPRVAGRSSQGQLELVRTGSTGVLNIAAGYRVQRIGTGGQKVTAVTTAAASIPDGSTTTGLVAAVTEQKGAFTESEPGTFRKPLSRIPGIVSVNNPVPFKGGTDEEGDDAFRDRIKAYVRSLPLCTPRAIEALALEVELLSGERVISATRSERADRPGRGTLYIDDGNGTVAAGRVHAVASETVLASATGGERRLQLARFPVVETEAIEIYVNGALQTRDVDYALMPGTGAFHLLESAYPSGLTAADTVTATYSYYSGLIAETQWRVDGRQDNPADYPGWRAFGAHIVVKPPVTQFITVDATLVLRPGYVRATAVQRAKEAVALYINSLPIGADVVRHEIIEILMAIPGVFDVRLELPAGNQAVADGKVARSQDSGLLIR